MQLPVNVDNMHFGTYIVQTLISLVATLAGVKVAMNGMKAGLERVENKLDKLVSTDSDMNSRIAVVEDRQKRL